MHVSFTRNVLITALILNALAQSAFAEDVRSASVSYYVQPTISVVSPSGYSPSAGGSLASLTFSGLKTSLGYGLTLGAQFHGRNSLETDFSVINSKLKDYGNVQFVPLLLNYKYALHASNSISIILGLTAGETLVKNDVLFLSPLGNPQPDGSYLAYKITSRSEKGSSFTYGCSAGLQYFFGKHSSVETTLKVLQTAESKNFSKGTLALIQAGYRYSF